jgi:hypothetical protein
MRRYHDLQDMPLQYRARVLPRAAGRSCDPIGWGYAVDRMPRGGINKTGRAGHRPHHHYTASAFNALYMVQDLDYPWSTCRALGHSVHCALSITRTQET